MGTAAGIYARISRDVEGKALGVARQVADCRALAESRGWEVADVYSDNDISGFSGKNRPEYQRMLADLEAGRIEAVVVWHQDRLTRQAKELENLIDVVEGAGSPPIAVVQSGDYDLSTPSGRMVARIIGATAMGESEHKAARIKAKQAQKRADGRPTGDMRAYGISRTGEVVEAEAERIREAASRLLAGESLYAITQQWNAEGVPTVKGALWSTTALRTVLLAPRIVGKLVHKGAVVGPAPWPAILDERTFARVGAVLSSRPPRARTDRSYLLSGLLTCGTCGGPLVGRPRSVKRGGGKRGVYIYEKGQTRRSYGCTSQKGCVNVLAEPVEELVIEGLLATLDGPGLAQAKRVLATTDADDTDAKMIAEDEAQLEQLGEDFAEGLVPRAAFLAAAKKLEARISETRARLAVVATANPLDGVADLRAEWTGLTIERKRAIISAVVELTIAPASAARKTFDPERVVPTWKV